MTKIKPVVGGKKGKDWIMYLLGEKGPICTVQTRDRHTGMFVIQAVRLSIEIDEITETKINVQ